MSGISEQYLFPDEPVRMNEEDADRLFVHGAKLGASDITIQSGHQVIMEIHGTLHKVTRRALDTMEVAQILNVIYGQNGSAQVRVGKDLDMSYEIRPCRTERYRFRVNATACYAGFEDGIQLTLRVISSTPPKAEVLKIERGILDAMRPNNGIVFVTGPTGSGKSTTLSACIRGILEDDEASKKLITYEAPIEYVYDEIESKRSIISQHEIPKHLASFSHSIRNALRRAPDIILVGECRDAETIEAAIEASMTGHAIYTTLHTNSVPETFFRLVNMFPQVERASRMYEILDVSRLIVAQVLVPTVDGKRCALREYLQFTQKIRDEIRRCDTLKEMTLAISRFVETDGVSMHASAKNAFEGGLISQEEASRFERRGSLFDKEASSVN